MIAARSVNEPDPHQQRITMALLPVPAALAITAAALLAPHKVAADVVFVVVVFTAVYIRRFGARGTGAGDGRVHVLLLHLVSAGRHCPSCPG